MMRGSRLSGGHWETGVAMCLIPGNFSLGPDFSKIKINQVGANSQGQNRASACTTDLHTQALQQLTRGRGQSSHSQAEDQDTAGCDCVANLKGCALGRLGSEKKLGWEGYRSPATLPLCCHWKPQPREQGHSWVLDKCAAGRQPWSLRR